MAILKSSSAEVYLHGLPRGHGIWASRDGAHCFGFARCLAAEGAAVAPPCNVFQVSSASGLKVKPTVPDGLAGMIGCVEHVETCLTAVCCLFVWQWLSKVTGTGCDGVGFEVDLSVSLQRMDGSELTKEDNFRVRRSNMFSFKSAVSSAKPAALVMPSPQCSGRFS